MTVSPDLLLAISGLLNFRNSCLSLEKWKPQTKSLVRQATRKQPLTVVKCHRVCESCSRLQVGFAFVDVGFRKNYNSALTVKGGSRGLVVKVLDSKFKGCEFKTHTVHCLFSKLRQFRLPYFASVHSAVNEYKHCLEGTCDGLVSRPGESV